MKFYNVGPMPKMVIIANKVYAEFDSNGLGLLVKGSIRLVIILASPIYYMPTARDVIP